MQAPEPGQDGAASAPAPDERPARPADTLDSLSEGELIDLIPSLETEALEQLSDYEAAHARPPPRARRARAAARPAQRRRRGMTDQRGKLKEFLQTTPVSRGVTRSASSADSIERQVARVSYLRSPADRGKAARRAHRRLTTSSDKPKRGWYVAGGHRRAPAGSTRGVRDRVRLGAGQPDRRRGGAGPGGHAARRRHDRERQHRHRAPQPPDPGRAAGRSEIWPTRRIPAHTAGDDRRDGQAAGLDRLAGRTDRAPAAERDDAERQPALALPDPATRAADHAAVQARRSGRSPTARPAT